MDTILEVLGASTSPHLQIPLAFLLSIIRYLFITQTVCKQQTACIRCYWRAISGMHYWTAIVTRLALFKRSRFLRVTQETHSWSLTRRLSAFDHHGKTMVVNTTDETVTWPCPSSQSDTQRPCHHTPSLVEPKSFVSPVVRSGSCISYGNSIYTTVSRDRLAKWKSTIPCEISAMGCVSFRNI